MWDELELKELETVEKLKEEMAEVEENIYFPSHYSPSGCPTVPLAFSGMTGRHLPPSSSPPPSSSTFVITTNISIIYITETNINITTKIDSRLGNQMCTFANLVALYWRLGYKIFLPQSMNSW